MSRTTACIMRINEQLERISGLDGLAADLLEVEEHRISELVDIILRDFDLDDKILKPYKYSKFIFCMACAALVIAIGIGSLILVCSAIWAYRIGGST